MHNLYFTLSRANIRLLEKVEVSMRPHGHPQPKIYNVSHLSLHEIKSNMKTIQYCLICRHVKKRFWVSDAT